MRHPHEPATFNLANNQTLATGMEMLSFCDDIEPSSTGLPSPSTDTTSEDSITSSPPTATGESGSGGSNQSSASSDNSSHGGLSTGAKAGIGIGAALGVILLLLGAFLLGRRRRRPKSPAPIAVQDEVHQGKRGLEMEGEKWVPELDAQKTQIPAELECPNTRYLSQPPSS